MLLIIGTVRLPPDRLPDAKSTMEAMILASRAEPGCLVYGYAEDVLEPGLIHVKEIWANRAALDDHFASANLAAWRSNWPALGVTARHLALYEIGDPQPI